MLADGMVISSELPERTELPDDVDGFVITSDAGSVGHVADAASIGMDQFFNL